MIIWRRLAYKKDLQGVTAVLVHETGTFGVVTGGGGDHVKSVNAGVMSVVVGNSFFFLQQEASEGWRKENENWKEVVKEDVSKVFGCDICKDESDQCQKYAAHHDETQQSSYWNS